MIVDHSSSGELSLLEADDFKGFMLRLRSTGPARPDIRGIAFFDDDNVLVDIAVVKSLAGARATEAWTRDFGRMVDYAATKGWVDTATNALRAHVERVP
jgi:hypothetical protein